MEDITTTSLTTTSDQTAKQPRPFVLALLLTGILYFGVKPTLPTNSKAFVSESPQTVTSVAEPVAHAVLQDVSVRSGLPKSTLRIVHAKQLAWQDVCLGLSNSERVCTQAVVPGWQVTVASGSQHWLYRTDASGSVVKLEQNTPSTRKAIEGIAIAKNFRVGNR